MEKTTPCFSFENLCPIFPSFIANLKNEGDQKNKKAINFREKLLKNQETYSLKSLLFPFEFETKIPILTTKQFYLLSNFFNLFLFNNSKFPFFNTSRFNNETKRKWLSMPPGQKPMSLGNHTKEALQAKPFVFSSPSYSVERQSIERRPEKNKLINLQKNEKNKEDFNKGLEKFLFLKRPSFIYMKSTTSFSLKPSFWKINDFQFFPISQYQINGYVRGASLSGLCLSESLQLKPREQVQKKKRAKFLVFLCSIDRQNVILENLFYKAQANKPENEGLCLDYNKRMKYNFFKSTYLLHFVSSFSNYKNQNPFLFPVLKFGSNNNQTKSNLMKNILTSNCWSKINNEKAFLEHSTFDRRPNQRKPYLKLEKYGNN